MPGVSRLLKFGKKLVIAEPIRKIVAIRENSRRWENRGSKTEAFCSKKFGHGHEREDVSRAI